MYLQFSCTHCGKSLKVREENVGRRVRCPYCQNTVTVSGHIETPSGKTATNNVKAAATGNAEGTDVSLKWTGFLGLVLTAVFYVAVVMPFDDTYFGELFYLRGFVPFVITFFMAWAAVILYQKWEKFKVQDDSMLFDLLPNQIAEDITPTTVDQFTSHIQSLPVQSSQSFLVNRVLRGLEHFRVLRNSSEVADRLAKQSEIDASAVESSYTLLRVFIWAIPILGFIGTVMGISAAVGGFSTSIDRAQDMSVLKSSLDDVTGGLAMAFDTTLLALVMSMLIMFPASYVQKREEDLLNSVDEYCNENLLKRLKDSADRPAPGSSLSLSSPTQDALQQSIEAAMAPHHAELRAWSKRLEAIGGTLTQQMLKGWSSIDQQLQAKHTAQIEQLRAATAAQAGGEPNLGKVLEQHDRALNELARRTAEVQERVAKSMGSTAESMDRYVSELTEGLAGLNDTLSRLAENGTISNPRRS